MCAPEFIYERFAAQRPNAPLDLRYALGPNQRPAWLARPSDDAKAKPLAFDPQSCQQNNAPR
jgi:hypothetical protein